MFLPLLSILLSQPPGIAGRFFETGFLFFRRNFSFTNPIITEDAPMDTTHVNTQLMEVVISMPGSLAVCWPSPLRVTV